MLLVVGGKVDNRVAPLKIEFRVKPSSLPQRMVLSPDVDGHFAEVLASPGAHQTNTFLFDARSYSMHNCVLQAATLEGTVHSSARLFVRFVGDDGEVT